MMYMSKLMLCNAILESREYFNTLVCKGTRVAALIKYLQGVSTITKWGG